MKAIRYTIAVAITIIAAASCQDNIAPEQTQESGIIINATIEDTQTKTELGEGTPGSDGKVHHKVLWKNTDNISVFDRNGNNHRFRTWTAGEVAKFRLITGEYTGTDFISADEYHAIYPGNKENSIDYDNKTISTSIATTQTAIMNGFATDLSVAYGFGTAIYNESDKTYIDMTFRNITALVKFEIVGEEVKQFTLLNKDGHKIGGDFTIAYGADDLVISAGTADRIHLNNITSEKVGNVTTYTANDLTAGIYYIALVPVEFCPRIRIYSGDLTPEGSNFNYSSGDGVIDFKGSNSVVLKPGMILDLGKFDSNGRVEE